VLAIGTGVTAYALRPDGSVREASGWGFPAGDEGGGAWIGHRALQAYLKHLDGRHPAPSVLFDAIPAVTGGDFDAIQTWLRTARATQYAALAPAVVEAAASGDPLADAILAAAAAELDACIAAVESAGPGPVVALLGGLAATFAPRLAASTRARLAPPRGTALDGLVRILAGPDAEALAATGGKGTLAATGGKGALA
jgi:glucosamine kinase